MDNRISFTDDDSRRIINDSDTPLEIDRTMMSSSHGPADDLVGNPPGWLLRYGIIVLFGLFLLMSCMTFLFKYPDKIIAKAIITSNEPPIEVLVPSGARVDSLLVNTGDMINRGDELAYLENIANRNDLNQLVTWIENIYDCKSIYELELINVPNETWILGNLQSAGEELKQMVSKFKLLKSQTNPNVQLNALDDQIDDIGRLSAKRDLERTIFKQEWMLLMKDLKRSRDLYNGGVISKMEYEGKQRDSVAMQKELLMIDVDEIENQIRISQLKATRIKEEENYKQLLIHSWLDIREYASRLEAMIREWWESFTISAPISGSIYLPAEVKRYQEFRQGDYFCSIISPGADLAPIAVGLVPSEGIGRIEKNNRIILRLDAYPYKQFGSIEGSISHLASIPRYLADGSVVYEAQVQLSSELRTTSDVQIPLHLNMPAQMVIITQNRSVAHRILTQFLNLF